ncbi:MAG: hypothetical protein HGA72_02030, partial [Chlorobiaceae bacterium]|nr:hypothetical protein [Chlorobiaceae bacterium]
MQVRDTRYSLRQRADRGRRTPALAVEIHPADDNAHLPHYHADLVLNQNIGAQGLRYPAETTTRLLRGTSYVLLR